MTSFIINSHVDRPASWKQDDFCTFCKIVNNELPSSKVFENDQVVAILDIMPLRRGHTLVIPKQHYARVSELPPEFAAATGEAVSKVANAITKALGQTGLNIVCNQEYAQAVPHVHYHIIPAPIFGKDRPNPKIKPNAPLTEKMMHLAEWESRDELDDEEAVELAKDIRARL
ncbi:hypothetical protein HGRIS_005839 [Hohenbuehelia grisea]|uniref:HIT domain-containing protein n=1 Tax=Hohenbuehelia grisea TaxID=104357 RepID=A0ABR3K052_9AGAR